MCERVTHRGGTIPLPPEFLVAAMINGDLSQLEPLAMVLPLPEANAGLLLVLILLSWAVSALDYIRFKFLSRCNHHHCRKIKAVAIPAVSLIALGLLSLL
ncbi:uncharacterized protein DS421_11g335470 [Arachis hypogaea]|nr:uncharacterized protein DS421_11g335470 [Arachis hypogaea]